MEPCRCLMRCLLAALLLQTALACVRPRLHREKNVWKSGLVALLSLHRSGKGPADGLRLRGCGEPCVSASSQLKQLCPGPMLQYFQLHFPEEHCAVPGRTTTTFSKCPRALQTL